MNNESRRGAAVISGVAILLAATIFGAFYYGAQTKSKNDSLSVTGSAKTRVTSDQAKLVLATSHMVTRSTLASGYAAVAKDVAAIHALLAKQGIADADIVDGPASMNQYYKPNDYGNDPTYELRQTVTVQSNDVNKVTDISKKVPDLASQGAIVSIQQLEYYYSKLPDLRVSLLTDAVKDAKARADKIAEGTGRKIGVVQSASNGVVQVLSPNSVDISDYGMYDTQSIEKDIMVTIKATFSLE